MHLVACFIAKTSPPGIVRDTLHTAVCQSIEPSDDFLMNVSLVVLTAEAVWWSMQLPSSSGRFKGNWYHVQLDQILAGTSDVLPYPGVHMLSLSLSSSLPAVHPPSYLAIVIYSLALSPSLSLSLRLSTHHPI